MKIKRFICFILAISFTLARAPATSAHAANDSPTVPDGYELIPVGKYTDYYPVFDGMAAVLVGVDSPGKNPSK